MRLVYLACLFVCLWATPVQAQSLTVLWDASTDSSVVSYLVYVGTSSGVYTTVASAGSALSWVHPGPIVAGQAYYAAVASVDAQGNIGPKSLEAVGVASQPPPPPPLPLAPVVVASVSTCRYVVTATKPDASSGWAAQFRRNGSNVGSKDSSAPYQRTVTVSVGTYAWDVVWTKSGVTSRTSAAATTTVCQGTP